MLGIGTRTIERWWAHYKREQNLKLNTFDNSKSLGRSILSSCLLFELTSLSIYLFCCLSYLYLFHVCMYSVYFFFILYNFH